MALTPDGRACAEFGAFTAAETEKWAELIQFAGIKQD